MELDLEPHSPAGGSATRRDQLAQSRHRSWPIPPTYHSKTGGTRYRFPTSADQPSSGSSLRITDSPPTSTPSPDQTVYSNIAFPPVRPLTSHSFSSNSTSYANSPHLDHRHSGSDHDARPASGLHHVPEHPRRISSLGVRKGIESRRASLPSAPTALHHPRGSRFWRTVLHDDPIMARPRFLSSARGLAPRAHRNSDVSSQSSVSNTPSVRPGSPHLWRTANRINASRPPYNRTVSDTKPAQNAYSFPGSYPAIPPLVFRSSSGASRTSLPDFIFPSSGEALTRGTEYIRRHSFELSPNVDDCEVGTEGEDQFESQVEVGESDLESESDVESESDIAFDDREEQIIESGDQFKDSRSPVKHAQESFLPDSSSHAVEGANVDSLRIVRIKELGPSPTNPSAIITEDRRYPCPHVGAFVPRSVFSKGGVLTPSVRLSSGLQKKI